MAPIKGAGLLVRLYTPTQNYKTTINPTLDIPGADVKSMITATSNDDKVKSGAPSASIIYEIKHISKLLSPSAYEKDPAHQNGTINSLEWQVYKLVTKVSRPGTESEANPKASTMICVGVTPNENTYDEYASWYDQEHVRLLSKVPGWRSSARYELAASFGSPQAVAPYLAVHLYDERNGLGGPEWRRSVETEWTLKVRGNCAPHYRRVWTVEDQSLL